MMSWGGRTRLRSTSTTHSNRRTGADIVMPSLHKTAPARGSTFRTSAPVAMARRMTDAYTEQEWLEEGARRFGSDRSDWRFVCPHCNTMQSARDFVEKASDAAAMREEIRKGIVGFSCIGRYIEGIGCDWTLGGFLQIHEACVKTDDGKEIPVFRFADI